MRLNCIIVYDMNRDAPPQRDIHYRPRATLERATIEPDIHPLVSPHDNEVSRTGRQVRRTSPAICRSGPEEMECISRSEKPGDNHAEQNDSMNPTQSHC